ncbi:hypothetical protein LAZ67_18000515 [Cordylochernes scorpioides]|uniref:Tc1-like transposase DDE domain-containing protein n=1 Tax=Cordylochernes scorpioides TaxID=51811 RepID=A0ABY6LEX6_9ARAC|nr:hypothetical protein LAZ67_18000515 [Cordylochernes scorpioides]
MQRRIAFKTEVIFKYRVILFVGWNLLGRSHSTPYFRRGTLTGQRYRDEIMGAYVMPQALEMGENFLLMDDNARPHRAGVVDTFLQNHAISRMNWPARFPDLNPIEHVWDNLGWQITSLQPPPRNTHELETALTQEWVLVPERGSAHAGQVAGVHRRFEEQYVSGEEPVYLEPTLIEQFRHSTKTVCCLNGMCTNGLKTI